MATLKIDDQTYAEWRERAAACGMTVEYWLKAVTAGRRTVEEPRSRRPANKARKMSTEAWAARLQALADRHPPTGYPLDDSRESIYD